MGQDSIEMEVAGRLACRPAAAGHRHFECCVRRPARPLAALLPLTCTMTSAGIPEVRCWPMSMSQINAVRSVRSRRAREQAVRHQAGGALACGCVGGPAGLLAGAEASRAPPRGKKSGQ